MMERGLSKKGCMAEQRRQDRVACIGSRASQALQPWPEAGRLADADDTLRKQQESAAKLKQDFEGLQQPEPDKAGNPLHTSNQVPFHEEELALPRQQDEAFSTSGSVRLASGPYYASWHRTISAYAW